MSDSTPNSKDSPSPTWNVGVRRIVSLLISVHLIALFVGPCASPPPSAEWARQSEQILTPYLHLTFLKDHGYRFFAPNPGPSHLVRYELLDKDGKIFDQGTFPDIKTHWPRLYYHRHFMISESLYNVANFPPEPPDAEAPEELHLRYRQAVAVRDSYLNSISKYLVTQHPEAAKVRIVMVQHRIPLPEDVANGRPLGDPDLYDEIVLGEYVNSEGQP